MQKSWKKFLFQENMTANFFPFCGSGLRWKAKALFLAWVANAIDVALSKQPDWEDWGHQQNWMCCMDRPMCKGCYVLTDGNDVKEWSWKSVGQLNTTATLHQNPCSNTQWCLTTGLSEPQKRRYEMLQTKFEDNMSSQLALCGYCKMKQPKYGLEYLNFLLLVLFKVLGPII